MNINYKFIGLYLCNLSIYRVSGFSRRSWNVLCRGNQRSAVFAGMLRQSLYGGFRHCETKPLTEILLLFFYTKNHRKPQFIRIPISELCETFCFDRNIENPFFILKTIGENYKMYGALRAAIAWVVLGLFFLTTDSNSFN